MFSNDWTPIKRIFLVSVFLIFVIIGISLYFNVQEEYSDVFQIAKKEANASYNKDLVYRRWAAMHGGVYVPATEKSQPNPYLSHIKERDIITPSGRKLTLVNPAYMTRQVYEVQENQYGVKGHITSLNPIRPGNKPDDWELKSLKSFENGIRECSEITLMNNKKFFRFMRPMVTEKRCLKCHAAQGYKEGDIRGGISTSVPMDQFDAILSASIQMHYLTHFIIAFCFFVFSIFSYRKLKMEITRRNLSQKELSERNKELNLEKTITEENGQRLKMKNEEYLALNEELTESNVHIQKINEELLNAKEKAEESDRLKSAFLANVSHEIRTPMNGIIGFSELLQKQNLSKEKQKLYTEIIKNNSIQLLDIVNDILDISKIEAGQMVVQNESVNLKSFITDIFLFFEPKVKEKKLKLILPEIPDNKNISIITDHQKLRQILYNLLSNSIKFTKQGSIHLGYKIINNNIDFFVKDTGIGIDKQYHKIIFERFGQIETTLSDNKGGTGLGLSICKGLAELLNGEIRVESEIDKGSAFYVKVPLIKAESIPDKSEVKNIELSPESELKILIAEDDEVNFFYLKELLKNKNLTIIRALNGKEAVEMCLADKSISLVLMDIKMPVMNGHEATTLIKKTRPELPIIAQTAFATSEDKKAAINAGCDGYISKPLNTVKIKEILKRYLI